MRKKVLVLFFCLPLLCLAQDYKSALGIKTGFPGIVGLNYKTFMSTQHLALDNMLGVNFDRDNRYVMLQSLFEYNKQFGRDLNQGYMWYGGAGPQIQYFTKGGHLYDDGSMESKKFFTRVNGVLGLEYTAQQVPFNAAIEFQPSLNVLPFIDFFLVFNIAVRYTFKSY